MRWVCAPGCPQMADLPHTCASSVAGTEQSPLEAPLQLADGNAGIIQVKVIGVTQRFGPTVPQPRRVKRQVLGWKNHHQLWSMYQRYLETGWCSLCCLVSLDIGITNWEDGGGGVLFALWREGKTWLNLKPFVWSLGVRRDNGEYRPRGRHGQLFKLKSL